MVWRERLKNKAVNNDVEDRVEEIKVAYGLISDIKGYHIHFWSSSNSSIEKKYDSCTIWRNLLVSSSVI
jgi:hypothetical protein